VDITPHDRQKLIDKSAPGDSGCIVWTGGCKAFGYGEFSPWNSRKRGLGKQSAHRVAWIAANGPIPDGMYVLHRCDNPPCINPEHLFLGTPQQNTDDMHGKGRWKEPRRRSGARHPRPMAKITEDDVRKIRQRFAAGEAQATIARDFGVDYSNISRIVRGRTWQHVT
jgi:hypothetical protein